MNIFDAYGPATAYPLLDDEMDLTEFDLFRGYGDLSGGAPGGMFGGAGATQGIGAGGSLGADQGSLWNARSLGKGAAELAEEIPIPAAPSMGSDVSGFANYGMSTQPHPTQVPYAQMMPTANMSPLQQQGLLNPQAMGQQASIPQLRNSDMVNINGLFNVGQKPRQRQQGPAQQQGNLMDYLRSLGG